MSPDLLSQSFSPSLLHLFDKVLDGFTPIVGFVLLESLKEGACVDPLIYVTGDPTGRVSMQECRNLIPKPWVELNGAQSMGEIVPADKLA